MPVLVLPGDEPLHSPHGDGDGVDEYKLPADEPLHHGHSGPVRGSQLLLIVPAGGLLHTLHLAGAGSKREHLVAQPLVQQGAALLHQLHRA